MNKKHCILLASQADWAAHQARILKALASSPRFKCYYRCHCFSETLSFAPFLASEPKLVGVPSLIECLLPARVFLSGIVYASPAFALHLNRGRIVNVTPEMPRSPDITTSFPIEDGDDLPFLKRRGRSLLHACATTCPCWCTAIKASAAAQASSLTTWRHPSKFQQTRR